MCGARDICAYYSIPKSISQGARVRKGTKNRRFLQKSAKNRFWPYFCVFGRKTLKSRAARRFLKKSAARQGMARSPENGASPKRAKTPVTRAKTPFLLKKRRLFRKTRSSGSTTFLRKFVQYSQKNGSLFQASPPRRLQNPQNPPKTPQKRAFLGLSIYFRIWIPYTILFFTILGRNSIIMIEKVKWRELCPFVGKCRPRLPIPPPR